MTLLLNDLTDEPEQPRDERLKFKFISNAFTAKETEVEGKVRKTLHCTASSTITDLHGDDMTEACVRDMARQAASKGFTIFVNHKYSIPEDAIGKVYASQIERGGSDPTTGAEIWDMHLDLALAGSNPRTEKTWQLIKEDGLTLGVSIGAFIEDYALKDEKDFWSGLVINKVNLIEASVVGIPANQRSWVQNGVIAIGKSLGLPEKQIRKVLDGKETPVKTTVTPTLTNSTITPATVTEQNGEVLTTEAEPTQRSVTIHKEGCDKDECDGSCRKDSQPTTDATSEAPASPAADEAAPATESPAEEATDDATTETTEETTSNEALTDAAPDIARALSAGETPALELVLAALEHAAEELSATRTRAGELETELSSVKAERDAAKAEVEFASQIVEAIAKSPLGRKAQFAAPVRSFVERYSGIYDEGFLKLIDEQE